MWFTEHYSALLFSPQRRKAALFGCIIAVQAWKCMSTISLFLGLDVLHNAKSVSALAHFHLFVCVDAIHKCTFHSLSFISMCCCNLRAHSLQFLLPLTVIYLYMLIQSAHESFYTAFYLFGLFGQISQPIRRQSIR